ncbi:MAG: APC family permease [Armatimonadota bacterium]|nr:APC family permease [Armatimonadota bacterium]
MSFSFRRLIFGSPLPSWRELHERLPKILALPIFASDALSSVAYATEEILLVLILAGNATVKSPAVVFISAAIVILLAIVATSYRQTIRAYPSGGGAYIVAKDNLGDYAGLTAGAALTIDYTLTVAVSIAAGVAAIVSVYPHMAVYRVELCLGFIGLVALGNLRGARESGLLFALPTYIFIASMFTLIGAGIYKELTVGFEAASAGLARKEIPELGLFLILKAFSNGCTAMTGTEAISNAVPAFRPPEAKNAATTLTWMAVILGIMFLGVSYLAHAGHVVPSHMTFKDGTPNPHYQTVVSQIARAVFNKPSMAWFYMLIQFATAGILVLAANTSFAGFPRLASIMARDRFLPRQLYNVGDRLVYSNGIILLALLASLLVIAFKGDTHLLIPLYAVGVFLSFTLSQAGMVKHSNRIRERGWQRSAAISFVGAVTTGLVTIVIAATKFVEGAWIVVLLIPIFVYVFSKIHQHYIDLGNQLRLTPEDRFTPVSNTVLVLTPSIHRGILRALEYAKTLSPDVRAIHVESDPVDTAIMMERWEQWGGGIPLVVLESQYRSLMQPILEYLEEAKRERKNCVITVVIPEFVPAKWWHKLLHNQSGILLKFALLFRRNIVTTNVRYYLER